MKWLQKITSLSIFLILIVNNALAWDECYIKGDMNGWSTTTTYKMLKDVSGKDNFNFVWRGSTNGQGGGDSPAYLEYKYFGTNYFFINDAKWYGNPSLKTNDYGTNVIYIFEDPANNINKTNISIGAPYIFSISNMQKSCSILITNISLCGEGSLDMNWNPSDDNNLMLKFGPKPWTNFVKYVVSLTNGVLIKFKFVPNKSWESPAGCPWPYNDSDSSEGPTNNSGIALPYPGGANLVFLPKETGYYTFVFNAISGQYKIMLAGGHGSSKISPQIITKTNITLTNYIYASNEVIKNVRLKIPKGFGAPQNVTASAGSVITTTTDIIVSNMNISPHNSGWIRIGSISVQTTNGIYFFQNFTQSTNQFSSLLPSPGGNLWNWVAVADNSLHSAQILCPGGKVNGMRVKAKSSDPITFSAVYQDKTGDRPGLGYLTNYIFMIIGSNTNMIGVIKISTNNGSGDKSYTNGFRFRITIHPVSNITIYTGVNFLSMSINTNQYINISIATLSKKCGTNLKYVFFAYPIEGAVQYPVFLPEAITLDPFLLSDYPWILIDDEAPLSASNIKVTPYDTYAKFSWIASSSPDASYYKIVYGENDNFNLSTPAIYGTEYTIKNLIPATKYKYKFYTYDDVNNYTIYTGSFVTKKIEEPTIEKGIAYPTKIEKGGTVKFHYVADDSDIKIFNIAGELIKTISKDEPREWSPGNEIGADIYIAVFKDKKGKIVKVKFLYGVN